MRISLQMDLGHLQERMGQASIQEAEAMRDLLVEKFFGEDTADIPDQEWMDMLEAAALLAA